MISAIVIGLIIGIIAKFLMPGKDPGGAIVTVLIGIAGAAIAQWIGVATNAYADGQPAGWVASIAGAMLLLWGYRVVIGRRGHRTV